MVFDLGTRELFLENDVAHEEDEVENIIFWPDTYITIHVFIHLPGAGFPVVFSQKTRLFFSGKTVVPPWKPPSFATEPPREPRGLNWAFMSWEEIVKSTSLIRPAMHHHNSTV